MVKHVLAWTRREPARTKRTNFCRRAIFTAAPERGRGAKNLSDRAYAQNHSNKLITTNKMIDQIKTVSTVEELYKSNGASTGEIIVDAVVDNVKRSTTHSSADIALLLKVKLVWLSGAMQLLVGLPLQEFIFRWRLMQAIDLLDNPELSVAEVAKRTGFRSENYLISVFRCRLGITPYAYRNGTVLRNGRYPFNQSAHDRKMLLKKAAELKSRNDEPTPEAE